MTYERFLKITLNLQKQEEIHSELCKLNVDLTEFIDPYHAIINELILEVYGEEGADWFNWFCYENDFGQKGLEACDENKNPICYSFDSLWNYLESKKVS